MARQVKCGGCGAGIAREDLNVLTDTAYCRTCGVLSRPSLLLADAEAGVDEAAVDAPPGGCRVIEGFGGEQTLRVSTRSLAMGGGALLLALFWNGITSIFVLLALSGTLEVAGVTLPGWFPVPTNNKNDAFVDSVGSAIFMWLFLAPFILIGLMSAGAAVFGLLGRVEVHTGPDGGRIFSGVGPLGWTRRFDPGEVEAVVVGKAAWQQNDKDVPAIEIRRRGRGPLRFGTMLPADRRAWLIAVLRRQTRESGRVHPPRRPWV